VEGVEEVGWGEGRRVMGDGTLGSGVDLAVYMVFITCVLLGIEAGSVAL